MNSELSYVHAEGWPYIHKLLKNVNIRFFDNTGALFGVLKKSIKITGILIDNKIHGRYFIILFCEILLKNRHLDFSNEPFQILIDIAINKLKNVPHLKNYLENFKRAFKNGYLITQSIKSRQVYTEHIFLPFIGIDIAHHIASFVS